MLPELFKEKIEDWRSEIGDTDKKPAVGTEFFHLPSSFSHLQKTLENYRKRVYNNTTCGFLISGGK